MALVRPVAAVEVVVVAVAAAALQLGLLRQLVCPNVAPFQDGDAATPCDYDDEQREDAALLSSHAHDVACSLF